MGIKNHGLLPTDDNGRTIHIPYRPHGSPVACPGSLVSGMTSTFPNGASNGIFRVVATVPGYFTQISSSGVAVAASAVLLPANVPERVVVNDANRFAFLGLQSNGLFQAVQLIG